MSGVVRPDGRMALMKLPRGCSPVLLTVFVLSVALDAVNLAGFPSNPEGTAKFACSLKPFALIGPLNFWMDALQFAKSQCDGHPNSLAISIIFLSIKMTMALGAVVILIGLVIYKPETFLKTRDELQRRFQKTGGYECELKEFMKSSLGILIPLICLLLLMSVSLDTRFDVKAKVLLEDGGIILLIAATVCIVSVGFIFASFAWSRRNLGVGT